MKKNIIGLLSFILLLSGLTQLAKAENKLPLTTDSRIKTVVFNENEVIRLKFHYGFQSFIEFSEDEEIELISLGESFPWRVTPAGKRLFVRPLQINVTTNMIVVTTKRTYQFEISSADYDGRADEELIYSVRFYYPSKDDIYKPTAVEMAEDTTALPTLPDELKLELGTISNSVGPVLNFDYNFVGDDKNITPVKMFDDGKSTYFQFEDDNLIIPSINSVDIYGEENPINYYINGDYVVVDTVQVQFSLRLSNKIVCIFNNAVM